MNSGSGMQVPSQGETFALIPNMMYVQGVE